MTSTSAWWKARRTYIKAERDRAVAGDFYGTNVRIVLFVGEGTMDRKCPSVFDRKPRTWSWVVRRPTDGGMRMVSLFSVDPGVVRGALRIVGCSSRR